jgi:hypothetical protein
MVIKIKANILKDFIKKSTVNGTIEDCKLEFKKDGLNMCHKDQPGVILVVGMLDKKAFNTYEEMELPIKNSKTLISVLGTFSDNIINIIKADNMVKFQDENGGIDLSLAEEVICFKDGVPELEYDNKVLVKKSMVKVISDRNGIVKSDEVKVVIKDKKIYLKIGKEIDKAEVSEMANTDKNIEANFDWTYFKTLTDEMDSIVDLSLSNELPSKFEEKSEMYTIQYYLTPITESE